MGSFINNSGQSNYTFYDNLTPIALNIDDTYTLEFRLAATFSGDVAAAWIDFDGDTNFKDDELITMSDYVNNVSEGTFTVPANAILNSPVRMRVSNIYNSSINPCGNAFGEVEDYLVTFSSTLSVDEFNQTEDTITLFPNPTNGEVSINSGSTITKLEVFDISGRTVIKQNNLNIQSTKFDITHLNPAIYLVKVHTENSFVLKKVIKN